MEILQNFWFQPTKGYTEETRGVSPETLRKKEEELGIVFPGLYRDLMQLQNGGPVRPKTLKDGDEIGSFMPIDFGKFRINTLRSYLARTKYEEDLKEMYEQFPLCFPDRLIAFGDFHGHGIFFFDYGWLQEHQRKMPKVVLITDYGDDFLHYGIEKRFDSFEEFINNLEEVEYNCTRLVIHSDLAFGDFIMQLKQKWGDAFQPQKSEDENYSSSTYNGHLPLYLDDKTIKAYAKEQNTDEQEVKEWIAQEGRTRNIKCYVYPNQYKAGTYNFQEYPDHQIVIEMYRTWFPMEYAIQDLAEELQDEEALKIKDKVKVLATF